MGHSVLLFFVTCLHILEAVEDTSDFTGEIKTQKMTFNETSYNPNSTTSVRIQTSTVKTGSSTLASEERKSAGDTDEGDGQPDHEHNDSRKRNEECSTNRDTCRNIVLKCGPSLLRDMSNGGDIEDFEDAPSKDPCRCLFHCFDHFGKACRSMTRTLDRLKEDMHENHTIFAVSHLGPLVGVFVAGVIVGILIALLIVNVVKQCMKTRPVESKSRETRSNSYGNLSVMTRGPMPPPSLETGAQGLYSENPVLMTPPPKYERTSDSRSVNNRGIYEEVGGERLFPVSDDSVVAPHVYLVLEKQDPIPENDTKTRNGSSPQPSPTDAPTGTATSCPDVVTEATNNDNRISNTETVSTPITKILPTAFDADTAIDVTEESKL